MGWSYMMLSWCFTVVLFLETVLFGQDASSAQLGPCISTKAGYFQGLTVTPPWQHRSAHAFLGIPYAKPPTGPRRFNKPEPKDFIDGVFSAIKKPPSCFQLESDFKLPWSDKTSTMSEDCLYLNVWAPENIPTGESVPVMVWIHGGGYTSGSSSFDQYDGQVLSALGQVVVVTLNYRLGPFGFMNTLTDDSPGNVGLYDQLLALQWVKTNIEFFGGDPERVTLFGESAGSMCTSLLALSPLSRGLFHRILLMSGSSYFSPRVTPSIGVENGNLLATLVGCANDTFTLSSNPKEVTNCLRGVPAEQLTKTYYKQDGSHQERIQIVFVPQFWDEIIPKHPIDILMSKNISTFDMFAGVTQVEGGSLFQYFAPEVFEEFTAGKLVINKAVATAIMTRLFTSNWAYMDHPQKGIDFYLKDIGDDEPSVLKAIYNAIGDSVIVCPTIYFSEKYSKRGTQVQFYRFDQVPSMSPWPHAMGAAHWEEVQFVFGVPIRYPEKYKEEEKTLSEYMIGIWTDFAKSKDLKLKDGSQWPSFSRSKPDYATFKADGQIVGSGERKDACEFWRPFFEAQ